MIMMIARAHSSECEICASMIAGSPRKGLSRFVDFMPRVSGRDFNLNQSQTRFLTVLRIRSECTATASPGISEMLTFGQAFPLKCS